MNLKKSDKMIAGIAVLVLIIAAVGIILYSEDKDDVILDDGKGKMISYDVNVDALLGSAHPDDENYQVSTKKNGAYTGVVDIGMQNVKSVTFYVEYNDKFTGIFGFGILGKKIGQDTFTVTISDMEGNEISSDSIKGSGNATITILGVTDMISTAPIEAESKAEAEEMLEERYADNPTNVTYEVTASIKYGELRIIKKLRERLFSKDTFILEVTYDYYDYSVEEPESGGNPPTSMPATSDYSSTTYYSTSFPGYK